MANAFIISGLLRLKIINHRDRLKYYIQIEYTKTLRVSILMALI